MSGRPGPWAVRAYRRALVLLPRAFRRDRGEAMVAMLEEAWRERRGTARALLLGKAFPDLLWTALAVRIDGIRAVGEEGGLSLLDVKLGVRMLAKYPGLSLVSVVGMAVAVAVGAGAFGSIYAIMSSELPFPGGDRVVSIETRDARDYGAVDRRVLHDFVSWRQELESVREISAFRDEPRNLIAEDGGTELVRVAEITASGLGVARVPPALGRPILEEDERPGAPPVVVIAHEEWQRRFDGDAGVLGRPLRLGTTVHTVVGVMPEGFRFPIDHRFWVPLRLNPADYERGSGPSLHVLGRLAEGASLEQAQAELTTIGLGTAAAYPASHEHLRPRIVPYTTAFGVDIDSPGQAWALRILPWAVSLLLVLVAVNVGILVYARTATRLGEIAVRSALGGTRRRIVAQLFVEALVLAAAAAAAGLTVAGLGLPAIEAWMRRVSPGRIPFWYDFGLSTGLMAYVAALAVVAGVIVGVVPGLKATGRRVHAGLHQVSTRGAGMQLGRTWTSLIVAQVALAVAVLPFVVYVAALSVQRSSAEVGYAAEEFLRVRLAIERKAPAPGVDAAVHEAETRARLRDAAGELLRRLEAEPAVSGVTFASHFPGGGRFGRIEVEGGGVHRVRTTGVDTDLFRVFDVPVLVGRGFDPADRREGTAAVIVDRVFVDRVLGGEEGVGRRIRHLGPEAADEGAEPGPWLEIAGIVPDFTGEMAFDEAFAKVYAPMALTEASQLSLAVRVRGGAAPFAGRLRDMAAAVDPGLQLEELRTAAAYQRFGEVALRFVATVMVVVTCAVLLLSAAGVYAMMSFTVARRRREIGIRSALGAAPRRVLRGILARAGAQLGTGVILGLLLALGVDRAMGGGLLSGQGRALLPGIAMLMVAVGFLAALGPARRGLTIEPTEALREE